MFTGIRSALVRTALGATLGAPFLVLAAAATTSTASASPAADDGAVLQGTWTVEVVIKEKVPEIGGDGGTRTYRFGEGCVVGESCSITRDTASGEGVDTDLSSGGGGFTFSGSQALDCFDQVTGELSTKHGADYTMEGSLRPSATEVRDGVTYVTALRGTIVETIVVNAAGRADDCQINDAYPYRAVQRAVLTGAPVPLPPVPPGSSSDPVGVDPVAAEASGTLPEFRLERSDTAVASAEAVDAGRRSSVPGALTTPADALDSVADRLPRDGLLVALLGLLIVFPAQIFNSTYEENHTRIERAFRRFRRTPRAGPSAEVGDEVGAPEPPRLRRLAVFGLCALAGTLLGGLLDPGFGANRTSAALLVGVLAALIVAVLAVAAAGWAFRTARHQPHHWYLRAIPSALVVAVVCVLVSRLTNFAPGYLFGLLGGAVFAGALQRRTEGRAEAVTLLAVLALALGAWVGFAQVVSRANEADASFGILVADALLGCLFIGGIEGLLFSLIPLRFLPGYRVRQWGWVPWGVLTLATAYLFVHVLLVPESGYLGRSTTVTATVTIALFVAFGVASCLFWAWFRFRPDPEQRPAEPPVEPVLTTPVPS
jgi:hypothetical protein